LTTVPCFTENKACTLSGLLGVFENVGAIIECKQLCKDTADCQYFNYYDNELVPSNYHECYLLEACPSMVDFTGSIIGFNGLCTCSLEVESQDGHLIKNEYTETEIECKNACKDETDCEIYTYYEPTGDCQLRKDVSAFDQSPLPGFHTGPGKCSSEGGNCKFALLDNNNHLLVESDIYLTVRSGMRGCKVNVSMILVGAGGDSYIEKPGGGGSGYINSKYALLDPSTSLVIVFGTNVSVNVNGDILLESSQGGDGYSRGGNGYSGGGYGENYNGGPYYNGGEDGGNGTCSDADRCGEGQGIDIRLLSSPYFTLTPGPRGNGTKDTAGGGGGVLVNGRGPIDGGGYGMGAGGSNYDHYSGCAILQIIV